MIAGARIMGIHAAYQAILQVVIRPRWIIPLASVLLLLPICSMSAPDVAAQGFGMSGAGRGSLGGRSMIKSPSSSRLGNRGSYDRLARRGMGPTAAKSRYGPASPNGVIEQTTSRGFTARSAS